MVKIIEAEYLQKVLGDKFKILESSNPDWILIGTDYEIHNGDLVSVYYDPLMQVLSDRNYYALEMEMFDDDWEQRAFVRHLLEANDISIGEDKELFKVVKSDFATEFDNFAKVISDIVCYVANDMIVLPTKRR